jgi:hypothetical protein
MIAEKREAPTWERNAPSLAAARRQIAFDKSQRPRTIKACPIDRADRNATEELRRDAVEKSGDKAFSGGKQRFPGQNKVVPARNKVVAARTKVVAAGTKVVFDQNKVVGIWTKIDLDPSKVVPAKHKVV